MQFTYATTQRKLMFICIYVDIFSSKLPSYACFPTNLEDFFFAFICQCDFRDETYRIMFLF